jgi:hypothetical protein
MCVIMEEGWNEVGCTDTQVALHWSLKIGGDSCGYMNETHGEINVDREDSLNLSKYDFVRSNKLIS